MNYSLGNMLSRGGALNPDGLSLDLAFAADKTLTARKGPTPTFTRASTATFVGSNGLIQSAAINAPRFDHDPVTLACKGLLIEESRTNLCLRSEEFNDGIWAKTNVTTAPNAIASPSGTVTADTLIEDTATSFHYIYQQFAKAASSSTYSYSIYYKNASGTRTVVLALTNGTSSGKAAIFTTSGTVTATNVNIGSGAGFTFVSANVESVGNDWYRASIVVTSDTSTRLDAVTYLNNSTTVISSYTGLMSSVYLWGAQLEAGSFPTSYIPTTTTALTRSADVCSITGGDFTGMYNGLEGTIIAEGSVANLAGNNRGMWAINNNTSAHGFLTYYDVTTAGISSQSRNTGSTTLTPNFLNSANTLFKRALAYRTGQASICTNGSSVTTTNVTISTQTMLTLQVGNMLAGSFYWSGHIARIQYFKKRLPDAKLQSLTAP